MIRLYTYSGFIEVDRQPYLKEPYLGRAVVQPGETSKPDAAPFATRLAHLSSDFNCCTYEITPEGHAPRTADKNSPKLLGEKIVAFGPGWTISVWHPNCEVKAEPVRDDRMTDDRKVIEDAVRAGWISPEAAKAMDGKIERLMVGDSP